MIKSGRDTMYWHEMEGSEGGEEDVGTCGGFRLQQIRPDFWP